MSPSLAAITYFGCTRSLAGEMGALAAGSDMATGQSQTTSVQEAAAAICSEDVWSSF